MPDVLSKTSRINNGFRTKGPLPYQLSLSWGCGATLISSKYAITAAHCLPEYPHSMNDAVLNSTYEVIAGAYKKYGNGERRRIKSITKPFDAEYFDLPLPDFVILELEYPFDLIKGMIWISVWSWNNSEFYFIIHFYRK